MEIIPLKLSITAAQTKKSGIAQAVRFGRIENHKPSHQVMNSYSDKSGWYSS